MKDKIEKVYIAGKLFKVADIKERIQERQELNDIGFKNVFNPIEQPFNEDKDSALPTSKEIFLGDTEAVIKSNIILAELDDEDPGVCMELGIAYGINYMIDLIKKVQNCSYTPINPNSLTPLDDIVNNIPKKEIFAHLTDIRVGSTGEYNKTKVPFGTNQYVVGGIEEIGKIYTDKDEMYKDMKAK